MARPRSEQARQKALVATAEILAECGFGGFTVEEVARRSGVAKTTIYRNWPSGQDLLFDGLNQLMDADPEPDTGSFKSDLVALATHLISMPEEDRVARRQLFAGLFMASAGDPRMAEIFDRLVSNRCGPMEAIVARAIDRGELRADLDVELVTDLIVGPVLFRMLFRDKIFTRAEVEDLAGYLERGVAVA